MDKLEQRLKKYALYLLGRRAYSEGEMRSKLEQKLQFVLKVHKVSKVDKNDNSKRNLSSRTRFGISSENITTPNNIIPDLIGDPEEIDNSNKTRDLSTRQSSIDGVEMTNIVEIVIQYLQSLDLLDDEAYAKSLTESLLRQSKSRRYIENRLKTKKIDKEIIVRVLLKDEVKESDSLSKLISSKLRHTPTLLSTPKGKEKLIRFLIYRGFSYGDIKKEIDTLISNQ